ncbi:trehalose-phosphatase [Aquabacterium sp.]|uniref:trehalose-phosphatase n=1 Tax=Aquabacterium sp. TaxID=1872578 RepID=UPI002489FFFB|nr:trehalose-phosphatase [Aquabacterium sp.]MDI1347623.1 trehalose-phosphatase [Aquabacterium sp.]
MRHLLSPEGRAALATTLLNAPLLAFDFDGTLAPIVARPDDACIPLAVAQRLSRLSTLLPLAIITGRTIDDVQGRLSFKPQYIIGNHGAEDPLLPNVASSDVFDEIRARLQVHAVELATVGVTVEDKQHSIALHYRLARDRDQALASIAKLIQGLGPAVNVYGGKLVFNVVSTAESDKAQALERLVKRCGARSAVFVGDDVNDEPVFARQEPTWLTVRIGRDYPGSQAMFCLESPSEVAYMLDQMLKILEGGFPSKESDAAM